MAESLRQAKEEILIAGWWLHPDVLLERSGDVERGKWEALLHTLQEAAERGVRVCCLIFREMAIAMPLQSAYTEATLRELHPTIHVMRHPPGGGAPTPWSHHEKLVIVDQHVAFVGGLDLALGRHDDVNHELIVENSEYLYPGVDYANPRWKDFTNVHDSSQDIINRIKHPRMPWHDIHAQVRVLVSPHSCPSPLSTLDAAKPHAILCSDRTRVTGGRHAGPRLGSAFY